MDKVPVLFRENLLYLSGKFKDMSEIEKINHVFEYNDLMGVETLNPLVSVVDWSQCEPMCSARRSYGFYAVFLKDVKCGDMRYGRQYYDYQEGTLVFLAPGQVYGVGEQWRKSPTERLGVGIPSRPHSRYIIGAPYR